MRRGMEGHQKAQMLQQLLPVRPAEVVPAVLLQQQLER